MVTMPGLPMLGHGQVEGFAEKYGMEFRRPLWDETPDRALIERHEREIFPLMRQRPLFAGVEHFLLYDFYSTDGSVNEDVFAYSNRLGDERGLVVYNNRFGEAHGWIKNSAAFAQKTGQGDEKVLVQRTLAEGLGLERRRRLVLDLPRPGQRPGVHPEQPPASRRGAVRRPGRVPSIRADRLPAGPGQRVRPVRPAHGVPGRARRAERRGGDARDPAPADPAAVP